MSTRHKLIFVVAFFASLSVGCSMNAKNKITKDIVLYNDGIIKYPYTADKDRKEQIKNNITHIEYGMHIEEVLKTLPPPDEVNVLYSKNIWKRELVGISLVYICERIKNAGSVNDKKEILYRINFDSDDRVFLIAFPDAKKNRDRHHFR